MTIKYFKNNTVSQQVTTYDMYYDGAFYGYVMSYENLASRDMYWKSDESTERFKTQKEAAKDLIGTDYSEE